MPPPYRAEAFDFKMVNLLFDCAPTGITRRSQIEAELLN